MRVTVGPPTVTIHYDDEVLISEPNAEMSSTLEQGYFCADTRLVSGVRIKLGEDRPLLNNSAAIRRHAARYEFVNAELVTSDGNRLEGRKIHLRLDRTIGGGIHEDYDVTNYARHAVSFVLEVSIESDFADLFDVKAHRRLQRGNIETVWDTTAHRLENRYTNGEFTRALHLEFDHSGSPPQFANGGFSFKIALEPRETWHTCLFWIPVLGPDDIRRSGRPCHQLLDEETEADAARLAWVEAATHFESSDPSLNAAIDQAVDDLSGMRLHAHDAIARSKFGEDPDAWVPAAGIPWFLSIFGRDALIVSLQTLALSPRFALGSLSALGHLQADAYDDERDMQPGKIEHEIRHGELAKLKLVPHTPYYGTHEATSLYVLVAAHSWRWHGDLAVLEATRPHVERALAWIDTDGDSDGDGLQEYKTRAKHGGYYNQGWKDAGDAIVDAGGELAPLPIALCEHQALVVAAKRSWASVLEDAYGEAEAAARLRAQADRLVDQIESRFWWEAEGTYYVGLDGEKRPIETVASNPGQMLTTGVVEPGRARRVADRLLAADMWSGWGIRTLSAAHPAYDPFSYQLGSVWPHDNALAAAGFRRYDMVAEAHRVTRALLDAAERFRSHRLPELFAGLDRDAGAFPVQYLGANVPQAWAAGALPHLVTMLLGLEADAAAHRLVVRPALPDWLSRVSALHLSVGNATLDLHVTRRADATHELEVENAEGRLDVALEA